MKQNREVVALISSFHSFLSPSQTQLLRQKKKKKRIPESKANKLTQASTQTPDGNRKPSHKYIQTFCRFFIFVQGNGVCISANGDRFDPKRVSRLATERTSSRSRGASADAERVRVAQVVHAHGHVVALVVGTDWLETPV